ncbi:MAG: hypothetical protein MZU84_02695 [Sphingobacterium sp.]|nr:hypothetical protein [Sphingobacterium sp.]
MPSATFASAFNVNGISAEESSMMENMNLLQSFGIDQNGHLVSVDEVARGKACDCCCPACGEVLIARQGEVRTWHFAHASGNDCDGGAESALHKAAKQLIIRDSAILVPALEARESHQLDDNRCGEAASLVLRRFGN